MTSDLAARIEAAEAGEQRELLSQAWYALNARPDAISTKFDRWLADTHYFHDLLGALAFTDAALMLVPEGWRMSVSNIVSPGCHAALAEMDGYGEGYARAASPALALAAAALRAKENDRG